MYMSVRLGEGVLWKEVKGVRGKFINVLTSVYIYHKNVPNMLSWKYQESNEESYQETYFPGKLGNESCSLLDPKILTDN